MDLGLISSLIELLRKAESPVKSSICAIGTKAALQFKKKWVEDAIIDEEYDDLKLRLNCMEKNLKELVRHIDAYCINFDELLQTSRKIGESAKAVFDPYHSLSKSTLTKLGEYQSIERSSLFLSQTKCLQFGNGYALWARSSDLADISERIHKRNQKELDFVREVVTTKALEAQKYIDSIGKTMKNRQSILTQYSRTTFELNDLLKKKEANQLSLKQSQQLFSQERKAEMLLQDYEAVNFTLKSTMPKLLQLNDELTTTLQQMVYYLQLTIFYQVDLQLTSLEEVFKVTNGDSDPQVGLSTLTREIDGFKIVNRYLNAKSSASPDKKDQSTEVCIALYDFEAQQDGDLTIKKGDRVKLLDKGKRWWKGELDGKVGLFPHNYVKLVASS
ncbi:hypothetical protein QFC19_006560 [Naganishia cerealis]|uniref:Uncharacterized protein n=1 Tax=Naganishia cerealis TaxID=610337 RepID=A0ACC2VFV4_9TREE|nr:hypothetical protein QFC19_006560 [Naganishia cerealis]